MSAHTRAIHNMLRRIDDQADHGSQFYLYRVLLKPTVTVKRTGSSTPVTSSATSSSTKSARRESTSPATSTITKTPAGSPSP